MSSKMVLSAYAASKDSFALICMEEDQETDREFRIIIQGEVSGSVVRQDELVRVSRSPRDVGVFAVLSAHGKVEFFSDVAANIATEQITGDENRLKRAPLFGFLNSISCIDETLYACGMGWQVYIRRSKNKWELISAELCTRDTYLHWFSNIQGLSGSNIFVDGLSGMLYHFDGSKWKHIESGTNIPIGEMLFKDDLIYIVAGNSTLITGNIELGFNVRRLNPGNLTLYTICEFNENIFVGTEDGIKILDLKDGRLQSIAAEVPVEDVFALQAIDQVMWSFGAHHAFRFDGRRWDSFDHLI